MEGIDRVELLDPLNPLNNESLNEYFQQFVNMIPSIEARLLATIVALLFLWLIRKAVVMVTRRIYHDVGTRYQARKIAGYITAALGTLLIGRIWFDGFETFTTFLGLVSAGLVIAMKDLLIDMAGWAFIVWRRPFHVGDRIQVGEIAGDVIDIRMFQFSLLEIGNWVEADQSTGRVIHVPNGQVFREAQANYTQGMDYIWNEIPVMITFESNWQRAKDILQAIASERTAHLSNAARMQLHKAAEKYFIFYSKLTPIVYTSVKDHGIVLTVRYLTEPRRRRGSEQDIWEDVLREFAACSDISFAYPTQRFYNQVLEGPIQPHPARNLSGSTAADSNERPTENGTTTKRHLPPSRR
jgi:small-conductance mechanosensitive channel